ncbi:MAG: hypothetical protein AAFX50_11040, partial [Acidobacteriota bacterium]
TSSTLQIFSDTDEADHIFGGHSAVANIQIDCSCDAACNNRCSAFVTNKQCEDFGMALSYCHMMQGVARQKADTKHIVGASCGAGYICGQRACLFCACGLSVGVTVNTGPAQVTVAFNSGNAEWSAPFDYTRTCPPCSVAPDVDPGSSGGGGGTGGDGGGSGGSIGGGSGGGIAGGGSGGGTGGGGGGSGGGFSVYCDGAYAGQATTIAAAEEMCEEDDEGGPTGVLADLPTSGKQDLQPAV